jgi:hypothetical protein
MPVGFTFPKVQIIAFYFPLVLCSENIVSVARKIKSNVANPQHPGNSS